MTIDELVTYKGKRFNELEEGEARNFLLKAKISLEYLKNEIQEETDARVNLDNGNLKVSQFKNDKLGREVFEALQRNLFGA